MWPARRHASGLRSPQHGSQPGMKRVPQPLCRADQEAFGALAEGPGGGLSLGFRGVSISLACVSEARRCASVWAAGDTVLSVGKEGGRDREPIADVTTASLPREEGTPGPTGGTAAVQSSVWTVGAQPPHLSARNLKETHPVLPGAAGQRFLARSHRIIKTQAVETRSQALRASSGTRDGGVLGSRWVCWP